MTTTLFGQLDAYKSPVNLRVKIKTALTGNLLTKTVHLIRTLRDVVNIIWKLNYERLI